MKVYKTTSNSMYIYEVPQSVPYGAASYIHGEFMMYIFSMRNINGDIIGTFRWFDYDDWFFS